MTDIGIIAFILLILGLAAWYVIRARRRGQRCIGCAQKDCGGCPGCHKEHTDAVR